MVWTDTWVTSLSTFRNAFVSVFEYVSLLSSLFSSLSFSSPLPCLVLSCLVVWCGVVCCGVLCVGVRVLACSTLHAVSLRRAGVDQLYQEKRMIGGIGNMLFLDLFSISNFKCVRFFRFFW